MAAILLVIIGQEHQTSHTSCKMTGRGLTCSLSRQARFYVSVITSSDIVIVRTGKHVVQSEPGITCTNNHFARAGILFYKSSRNQKRSLHISALFLRPQDCNSFLHCSWQVSFICSTDCLSVCRQTKHTVSSRLNRALVHYRWVAYIH